MSSPIHKDLEKTERRESHLWFLTLGLLVLFGGTFLLFGTGYGGGGPDFLRSSRRDVLAVLFGLVVLFSLYVLNSLMLNGRLRHLLMEMGSLAASGKDLDRFLPSITAKIAHAGSASTCRIMLLSEDGHRLSVRSAYADGEDCTGTLGGHHDLVDLARCRQVLGAEKPVVLSGDGISDLSREDREVLVGAGAGTRSIVILPLIAEGRILGLIALGRIHRFGGRSFGAATMSLVRTLAGHAATAISQAQLKRQAIHDPLTSLYNRRHLSDRLKHEIAKASRSGTVLAVLLCDLDRFKQVNDTHGHQVGDELLRAVAQSIQASTRNSDLVFRWGGDEIVVILAESTREGVLTAADRIRQGVVRTSLSAGLDIDVSIGIARYPEHGENEDDLIRIADRALYIAKKSGDNVRIGEEDYLLDASAVKVVFQPVVEVPSYRTVGYEALCRDPAAKLTVGELFEKYRAIGRLKELKEIILRSQIDAAVALKLERVFINADFSVLNHLEPIPKPPGMDVVIELSELEALHDLENHLAVAGKWRAAGYQFALDDFGAGFISFPFLATLVPEYIKVDRSTLMQAVGCEKFRAFLTALLLAVRGYAIAGIIAEGVEEQHELQVARDMGMTLIQGYYFGRPQELTPELVQSEVQSRVVCLP